MWRKVIYFLPVLLVGVMFAIAACTNDGDITKSTPVTPNTDDPLFVPDTVVVELAEDQPEAIIRRGAERVRISYDRQQKIVHYDCGDLHWEFSEGRVREYTSRHGVVIDELIIIVEDLGWPLRQETYIFNGERLDLLITNENPTERQVQEFLAFYESDPSRNTLEANPDGELMVQLLHEAEPQIERIWQERDPVAYQKFVTATKESGPERVNDAINRACALAKACVATKCWFGGLSNSVCAACSGVTIACYIMEFFGWI